MDTPSVSLHKTAGRKGEIYVCYSCCIETETDSVNQIMRSAHDALEHLYHHRRLGHLVPISVLAPVVDDVRRSSMDKWRPMELFSNEEEPS